ncbi:MAG TPA: hypothetical protein VHH92_01865 [Actinomycetota bacterium]|nr:hypothetical protein [Actinomycetota bacterium]
MEPITGLSPRALLFLLAAVVLGVVASTVATTVAGEGQPGCPDDRYGCATFLAGEPVLVGVLTPRDDVVQAVRLAVELRGARLQGRRVRILHWNDSCTPEGGSSGARELATDAPDEPPVIGGVAATCPEAAAPAAQILSDSGIALTLLGEARLPAGTGDPRYALRPGQASPGRLEAWETAYTQQFGPPTRAAVAAAYAADAMLDAAATVAEERDGSLLVPRTPLRDRLLAAGFRRLA